MSWLIRLLLAVAWLALMARAVVMGVIEGLLGIKSPPVYAPAPSWLTVSPLPAHKTQIPESRHWIEALLSKVQCDAEVVAKLSQQQAEVIPYVLTRFHAPNTAREDQLLLAVVLVCLRHAAGTEFLRHNLQNTEESCLVDTLEMLALLREDETQDHVGYFLSQIGVVETLLILLRHGNPEVRSAAIQACGLLRVPGALERFEESVVQPEALDRGRMIYWIGRDGKSSQAIELIGRVRRDWTDGEDIYWMAHALEFAISQGTSDDRKQGMAMVQEILGSPSSKTPAYELALPVFHRIVGRLFDESTGPWLAKFVKQLPPDERGDVYTAMVHNRIEGWHEELVAGLQDMASATTAAWAIARAYRGEPDLELVTHINRQLNLASEPAVVSHLCAALAAIGGVQAWDGIEQHHTRAAPWDTMQFRWQLRGWQLADLKPQICSAFALNEQQFEQAMALLLNHSASMPHDAEDSPPPELLRLLHVAQRLAEFRRDDPDVSYCYDQIMLELAQITGGLWQPYDMVVASPEPNRHHSFSGSRSDQEDLDRCQSQGGYQLEFFTNKLQYIARFRNLEEGCDADRVIALANRVLADMAMQHRFALLDSDKQHFCVVFVDPACVPTWRDEYAMPFQTNQRHP